MSSDAAEKFPSHEFDAEEVDGAELSIRVMWHE